MWTVETHQTVVWTRIDRCVFDDNENAYFWKGNSLDRVYSLTCKNIKTLLQAWHTGNSCPPGLKRSKNFEKSWVTLHMFCCRFVFSSWKRKKIAKFRNPGYELSCTLNQSILTKNLHNCGSLFYRHEEVSWPLQYKLILNQKRTEE